MARRQDGRTVVRHGLEPVDVRVDRPRYQCARGEPPAPRADPLRDRFWRGRRHVTERGVSRRADRPRATATPSSPNASATPIGAQTPAEPLSTIANNIFSRYTASGKRGGTAAGGLPHSQRLSRMNGAAVAV